MIQIDLFEQTAIETYAEVTAAFNTCVKILGDPGERWTYGKSEPDFLGSYFCSSPAEIDYLEFRDDDDAMWFKLKYGTKSISSGS